ncbi:hypothetical protein [Sporosarcina globispora]|uniref:hypothetical protein n=1 Tax=Sporosarcina globispora TaxID=1459 RepID=UPI000A5600BF|nr:hypothetical protein [Sporosarcina globispora]
MRKYLFTIILALIILSIINQRSIQKAVELYEEEKGTPQVEKDFLAINWSVSCESESKI